MAISSFANCDGEIEEAAVIWLTAAGAGESEGEVAGEVEATVIGGADLMPSQPYRFYSRQDGNSLAVEITSESGLASVILTILLMALGDWQHDRNRPDFPQLLVDRAVDERLILPPEAVDRLITQSVMNSLVGIAIYPLVVERSEFHDR